MKRLVLAVAVAAAAVLVSGCGKERESTEADVVAGVSPQEAFFTEIRMLEETEGVEAVMSRARTVLDDPEHADIRAMVFDYLIHVYSREGRIEEAQALYFERGSSDAELAESAFQQIMNASLSDDADANAVWLERIITGTFPASLRVRAWQERIAVYGGTGSVAPVAARVEEIMGSDLAASSADIFTAAFSQGMRIGDLDGVEVLLESARAYTGEHAALGRSVLIFKGELMLARGQLDNALDHYLAHATALGDADLNRGLRPVLRAAQEQGRGELVKRGVAVVYERGAEFPSTRDMVATLTIGLAADTGDPQELLSATTIAYERGASLSRIYPVFLNGYYPAVQGASQELRSQILALIERMRKTEGLSEHLLGMMGTALLDGAFFGNDYKGAIAVVEQGIPGFDEAWHQELKDKINAHIALQEKRFDDAVALFRLHMTRVAAWKDPMTNPEDGRPVIKEVVLGFNEKRIGDIWAGVADREADSRAAYAAARRYYQDALAILVEDTPERERAIAEMAAIPGVE